MNKITLILLVFLFSITGYSQIFENFENTTGPTLPTWTLTSGTWGVFDNSIGTGNSWTINANSYSGVNAAYINRDQNGAAGATSEDYLATPLVTVPNNGQLRFFSRTFTSGLQGTLYQVRIAPATANQNDPSAYTILLQQYNEDQLTFDDVTSTQNAFNVYSEHVINLPSNLFNTQVYISFVKVFTQPTTAIGGDRWLLDDVQLVERCLDPTNLAASPQATTSTLTWAGTATSFEIENVLQNVTPTGIANGTSTTNSVQYTGLLPNTDYCFYVRAICTAGNSSNWVGPFCYTTTTLPPVCGGNYVDEGGTANNYPPNSNSIVTICPDILGEVVTVQFTSFSTEANFDGMYIFNGNSINAPQIPSNNPAGFGNLSTPGAFWGTASPGIITSSSPDGCLTFQFLSEGFFQTAGWESNVTCGPPPSCPTPSALSVFSTTNTTATVNWTSNSNATLYNIYYVPCGGIPPTSTTTPTITANSNSNYIITGLTADTCYDIYVRDECGIDDYSFWIGPITANTQVNPPVCGGLYTDPGGSNSNYENSTDSTVTICPDILGQVVTVQFTSFNTESNFDGLYVFNGNSVNSPQIPSANGTGFGNLTIPGSFWGTISPGIVTSSSPDGCLTFRFVSDGSVNNPGWIANVTCGPPPTCPTPSALSLVSTTNTTATVNWTSNSTATLFNIYYVPCGGTPPTSTTTPTLTANSNSNYIITGLTADTCYDIYVRDECGIDDYSFWIGPITANTQVNPPVCGGLYTDAGGVNGNYPVGQSIVTVCPEVPGDVVTVQFTSFNTAASFDGMYVYNGNSVNAPQIPSSNGAGFTNELSTPGAFWGTVGPGIVTSSSPDGCLTFRFESSGFFQSPGWTANVICGPPPTCPTPTALSLFSTTNTTATVNWTSNSNATLYNIYYVPCGGTPPTATTTPTLTANSNSNYIITGLSADTCYEIYVRDECAVDDYSFWIGPLTANTQVNPPVCGGTYTDPGGSNGNYANNTDSTVTICPVNVNEIVIVTFTFFQTESSFDGLYVYDGNSINEPQISSGNGGGNVPGGLPGSFWGNLTGGNLPGPFISSSTDGCLTFRFRSDGSVNNPGWIANVECVPAPTCRKPNNLTASNIALTTATLGWNQPLNPDNSIATAWEVLILPDNAPAPTNSTSGVLVSNPYNVTGLTSATCYDYYVRAKCSDTDFSFWSGPFSFCTLIENDECAQATTVLTNPDLNCVNFASGSLVGATISSQLNTCAGEPTEDVWFQFEATATDHFISVNNIIGNQFNLGFAVYSGNCATPTQLSCQNFNLSTSVSNLTIGQTYYIRVFLDPFAANSNITFNVCVGTLTPPIAASTAQFTTQQLVEDVLLNTTCAQVTNITTTTGTNFGQANGIGYFNQNNSSFPFTEGVVLATRDANFTPGPNNINAPFGGQWPGDADLFNYIQASGIDAGLNSYNDASVLEFDFVPLINNISFDFIFASEEYGFFQCTFSDAFAFFLTNNTTNVTTNLAVVPTTNQPISVLTIRDNQFNPGCASVNPELFSDYYLEDQPGGLSPFADPINFNGWTVPLTASSAVIPGQQYHIKLVVADRNDSALDSAVFLKGGSFNIGNIELGGDFLIEDGTALCDGDTQVITADLDANSYNFAWTLDTVTIPNENGPSITVTQPGVYALTATYINTTCGSTDSLTVQYYDPLVVQSGNTLTDCNNTGFGNFDLTTNNSIILNGLNPSQYTVTFYNTQDDATNETNPIAANYANVTPFLETVYVRVENQGGCFAITQFDLVVQDLTPTFTITPDFNLCQGNTSSITVTPINYNETNVTYSWTLDNNPLPDTTGTISVTQGGTYVVTVNQQGCTATGQTVVTIIPTPIPDTLTPVTACETYTLLPLTVGSYYTASGGPNGTGTMLNSGEFITSSTTLYIYAASTVAPTCFNETTFEVTINNVTTPATFAPLANVCQNDPSPMLPLTSQEGFTGTWSGSFDTSMVGTQTLTFIIDNGQCASNGTLSLTIIAPIVATFVPLASVCQYLPLPTLPTTSQEGFTGTWSGSFDTSMIGTQTITFIPDAGQCAVNGTLSLTITAPNLASTFAPLANVCQNDALPILPTTSLEGFAGTWSGTFDTGVVGTQTITFIPNTGQCAVNGSLSLTITAPVQATFSALANVCQNTASPNLPTMSLEGFAGTWSGTFDTTLVGTQTLTFTPNSGQCALSGTLSLTIIAPITAIFNQLNPFCQNDLGPALPTLSLNNIQGFWTPSTVNTTTAGTFTYVFTPTTSCSLGTTMDITINAKPTLDAVSNLNGCSVILPTLSIGNYFSQSGGVSPITDLTLTTPQTVYVYATNGTCSSEASFTVTIDSAPSFTIAGDCSGGIFVLTSTPVSFSANDNPQYAWTNSAGEIVGTSSTLNVTTAGIYTLTVTIDDCESSQQFNASDVGCMIPKGISPNGDGLNDSFDLTGFNVKELSIFNRYGTKVYNKTAYTNQWIGQSDKGNELPDGTYYYIIERDNTPVKTGWIYINREVN